MKVVKYFVLSLAFLVAVLQSPCFGKTEHTVYFENTDYELHVYHIYGTEKGKTLMIIGGIQGDEPGGYTTADLFADITLKKGNMIVVPRANFLSIIKHKREINNDMNRRFKVKDREYYEDKIVEILRELIGKSDYLLNLHEGSGFYSETRVSNLINPDRFGQSIIADADMYKTDDGRVLYLGRIASEVATEVNATIKDESHYFRFNNHHTLEKTTRHPEQRKSATFYALSTHGIPAFGIEVSKEIHDLEKKVRYQATVINAFLEKFGILPDNPRIVLDAPRLNYIVVSVNGDEHIVHNNNSLRVSKGDNVTITDISANYRRGLSADISGIGAANMFKRDFIVQSSVKANIKKDGVRFGGVSFDLAENQPAAIKAALSQKPLSVKDAKFKYLVVELNGLKHVLNNKEHLKLIRGDKLMLLDVVADGISPTALTVNFLGFVGDKVHNTGEDRGYTINTAKDLWKDYSLDKTGKSYSVEISIGKSLIGAVYVDIDEPKMDYIVLKQNSGVKRCYTSGDVITFNSKDTVEIVDAKTNVNKNDGITYSFEKASPQSNGAVVKKLLPGDSFHINELTADKASHYNIVVTRDGIVLGKTQVKIDEKIAFLESQDTH
ncbi:MAG: succinylglutamate desuccinylase/aspartoacylase family protein [Nitrospirae bacterium]|nr:succinylglutamate desuccinylase/aspartoacylase family protein [Nitrospirota bacterium]